jgi:NAD(P)H dehydrogenase (quinone)
VTGASGQLGGLAIEALLKRAPAENVVALVRRADAAAPLEAKGVEVRIGDYTDPAALEKAFRGIDRLLLISATDMGKRVAQHANVTKAAKAAGVGFIAYTSILKANAFDYDLAREHAESEKRIAASGIAYAFLRNGWYNENAGMAIGPALQYGVVMGAAGDGRISSASRRDYAEAAAIVLTADTPEPNAVYELAGDGSYSLAELAAEIASASGKQIVYKNMPEAGYKAALEQAGLPAVVAGMLAGADAAAAKGALYDESGTLSRLIGHSTAPWRETVRAMVAGAGKSA